MTTGGERSGALAGALAGKRLLIVTPEILGPIRNGGIATAFNALARLWQEAGARTTIAYVEEALRQPYDRAHWTAHYGQLGIEFIPIARDTLPDLPQLAVSDLRATAWQVHHWLEPRAGDYDLVVFPDWTGVGFYALLARDQGIAYRDLPMAVNTHGPSTWTQDANLVLAETADDVDRDYMERESVRRADFVVSPSAFLLDWMRDYGWAVAPRREVIQNLLNPEELETVPGTERRPVRDVVFFGRLEKRKGLKLFCDAIDRLLPEERCRIETVHFFGRAVPAPGFDPERFIAERSAAWGIKVEVRTDLDREAALGRLCHSGTLAVMPSKSENSPYTVLECLHHGVGFLATRAGGTAELIDGCDRDEMLFPATPEGLAGQLRRALRDGVRPARQAVAAEEVRARWIAWTLEATDAALARRQWAEADGETPLVTVCITTYERPALLAEAIASIEAQTYPAIEIVVVDDGSRKPETLAALDRLAAAFAPRGWQVLRQENAYVGAARNTGTAAAQGEYILFMDDDDVAVPEEVATFVAVARRTGADILTCASSLFEGAEPPARPERLWVALGGALGAGIFQNAFGSVNAFWRRQVYLDLGGHTTDYGIGYEDWEMFAQAMIAGYRLDLVPRALFHYRVSTTGMLRTTDVDTNLARSARAFVKYAPLGLGVAIGHAVHLERQHELARRRRPTYGELIRRDLGWTRRWLRRRLRHWFGI